MARRFVPFVILGLLLIGVAGAQEDAARSPSFLERRLEALVPGLRVEGLSGAWRAAPVAERITLSDVQGTWLTMQDVRLDLAPTALLRGVLRLEALNAALLRVERLPVTPTPLPQAENPPPGQGGLLPALPDLPVDLSLDHLSVQRLELAEAVLGQDAAFSLTGSAELEAGRLTADLSLQRLDRDGSVALNLALAPEANRLNARVGLREPEGGLVPTLLGLPQHPATLELNLDGPADGAALSVQAQLGPEIALDVQGTVRSLADGSFGARLQGQARGAPLVPADYAGLLFPAQLTLNADRSANGPLAISELTLKMPSGQGSVNGTFDIAREVPDLTIRLSLDQAARFAPLLPQGVAWEALQAEAHVTGTLSAPEMRLEATPRAFTTSIPQADAVLGSSPTLSGTASLLGPRIDMTFQGQEGQLAVVGSLVEPTDLTARLALPRLEVFGAESEGALEATAQVAGPLSDPTITLAARSGQITLAGRTLRGLSLDARLEAPVTAPWAEAQLAATLDGEPVRLALRGRPAATRLRLEQARLRVGPGLLTATGVLDPDALLFAGSAQLEATALAPLGRLAGIEGLEGRLRASGKFGPRDGVQGFDLTLEAPRLAYAGTSGRLRATVEGMPGAFAWGAEASAEQGSFTARGRLVAADQGWQAELAALRVEAAGETVRLVSPTRALIGQDGGVALGAPLALAVPRGGRINLFGHWGPDRADLTANLSSISAALAGQFLPDLSPIGTVAGEVRVTGPVSGPELRATLRGSGLRPGASWSNGLPSLNLRAEASWISGAARLRAELEAGRAGRLTLTAALPQGFGDAAQLEAGLEGSLALQPLAAPFLAAGANRVAGRLQLALKAGGTLGAPELGGRATLSGGEYRNLVYGIRVRDISGTIVGEGTRLVVERLGGRTVGGGTIALRGGVDFGVDGLPADLTLTARNARPAVSDLVTATVDAGLRLVGPLLGNGLLSGQVRVQRAEVRIPQSIPSSVPVLENVRVRGTPPPGAILPPSAQPNATNSAAPASLPPIRLEVAIMVPGQIFVRGRGVDAELGGGLRIGGTLAKPVPQGGFDLRRGTLSVLARRLTFDRGRIDFANGTLMPRLDLTARSQAGSTSITVSVQGTPTKPEITFSSSPELPQDEILARLLFDRSTDRLSPFEIAQIAAAVAQLTGIGGGGEQTLDQLRRGLGLDRLGIAGGTEAGSGPAAEAGRYVAPGVYLGIRQGVQGGQTGVGVEVELTPRLKLEGQTATGAAGDRLGLTYEFEY